MCWIEWCASCSISTCSYRLKRPSRNSQRLLKLGMEWFPIPNQIWPNWKIQFLCYLLCLWQLGLWNHALLLHTFLRRNKENLQLWHPQKCPGSIQGQNIVRTSTESGKFWRDASFCFLGYCRRIFLLFGQYNSIQQWHDPIKTFLVACQTNFQFKLVVYLAQFHLFYVLAPIYHQMLIFDDHYQIYLSNLWLESYLALNYFLCWFSHLLFRMLFVST